FGGVPVSEIAIFDTGTPPNGLGGRSPTVPSWRSACRWFRCWVTVRSRRSSRRGDGAARGALPGLLRLRDRRFDFCDATVIRRIDGARTAPQHPLPHYRCRSERAAAKAARADPRP